MKPSFVRRGWGFGPGGETAGEPATAGDWTLTHTRR
jgi:hypothetical protein